MTYRITKRFEFAAAHHLSHLPPEHKCHRVHGHNYVIEVALEADELDSDKFVEDYGSLADIKAFLNDKLDHRDLNDLMDYPTAEMLALFLYATFKQDHPKLTQVIVSETPNTTASYRP